MPDVHGHMISASLHKQHGVGLQHTLHDLFLLYTLFQKATLCTLTSVEPCCFRTDSSSSGRCVFLHRCLFLREKWTPFQSYVAFLCSKPYPVLTSECVWGQSDFWECVRACYLTCVCVCVFFLLPSVYSSDVDVFQPCGNRWWLHRSAASVQSQEPAGQN